MNFLVDELKAKLEELRQFADKLASEFSSERRCETTGCPRSAVARGKCAQHYRRWRRDECQAHGVKTLREIVKAPEVPENQMKLFPEVAPGPEPEEPVVQF